MSVRATLATWVVAGVCVAVHLARLLGDHAAFVDGIYAHGAWMLAHGFEPYVDFTHVALLPADLVLAAVIRVFGADARVLEVATTVVILTTGGLLALAARRVAGGLAAGITALLWCTSLWVVHFHLFERETWAALGIAAALAGYARCVPTRDGEGLAIDGRRALLIGAGLALAFSVKITSVFAAAGLCAHLLLSGRVREAWRLGVAFTLLVLALAGVHALAFGDGFVEQAFLFGFFRHGTADLATKGQWILTHGDHVLVLTAVGLVVAALRRPRGLAGAAACVFLGDLTYMLAISPTLWDHNLIPLAASGALLGGLGVAEAWRGGARWLVAAAVVAGLGVVAIVAAPALDTRPYGKPGPGFGGTPRHAIERRATFLERHSAPGSVVFCVDPWPAFLAERVTFVRYWDVQPVMVGITKSVAADGYAATFAQRGSQLVLAAGAPPPPKRVASLPAYSARLLANAIVHIRPPLLEAIAAREIALVMEPLAPLVLEPADLEAAGYERFGDLGFFGWRPVDGVVHTRVRPVYPAR